MCGILMCGGPLGGFQVREEWEVQESWCGTEACYLGYSAEAELGQ